MRIWFGVCLAMVALTVGSGAPEGGPVARTSVALATAVAPAELPGQEYGYVQPPHQLLKPESIASSAQSHPPAAAPTSARPVAVAAAPLVIGSAQQALINQDRAAAGLRPLTWSSCLYSVAASNAQRMAAQGFISHTNGPYADMACGLAGYAGENVGYWTGGVNDAQLNTMFMNSPDHRANIMGPYRYVATAWVTAPNGSAYIAVEFS